MLFLLLVFFLTAAALTVFLWVGTLFFQGYIYTEPSPDLYWQAPAAGVTLALFLTFWLGLVQGTANAREMPYDTLFRFSPQVEKYKLPAPRIWAVRKDQKEPVPYKRNRIGQTQYEYREPSNNRPYSPANVQALLVEEDDGTKVRMEPAPRPAGSQSPYREFVDPSGWSMTEYETGPTGQLVAFRYGRFIGNLVLNLVHFAIWFLCLWLLLRFTWVHAVSFAFVLWLVVTLTMLPMMLSAAVGR